MTYRRLWGAALAVLVLGSLAGCDGKDEAAAPVTLDARQTTIYANSCKTCHEDPGTGAPQTHDIEGWAPRTAKGEEQLLENIVNGFNGMPPLGQCIECDADDFVMLTRFMASPAPAAADGEAGE